MSIYNLFFTTYDINNQINAISCKRKDILMSGNDTKSESCNYNILGFFGSIVIIGYSYRQLTYNVIVIITLLHCTIS